MKIGVLVKQVPVSDSSLRLTADQQWIEETSLNFEMNENDSYALEEALQIREGSGEGEVVVVSLGPADRTPKILREALSKGADRGIHIIESTPFDSDPYVLAKLFHEAVKDEAFDLLLCGLQSDDMSTGQTGLILGELLGMSTATMVVETNKLDGSIKVKRELESGWFQWVTLPFPACVTIQSGINQPRYASLKGIMSAKRKEIKAVDKSTLNPGDALQSMSKMYVQHKDKRTEMIDGDTQAIVTRLIEVFKNEAKVL